MESKAVRSVIGVYSADEGESSKAYRALCAAYGGEVRLFGTGERIVFLPYTDTAFKQTQDWMKKHNLFAEATL